ncbi:NPT1-like protein [Saccharomyces kudriavzevii IFO 1802]|uniref:NPT1-like protein n=1 Tax=Saccharomyces kudriavzevii (strain ATCC MYA-4449 / AS 2.2408 / CBS 8840 / NBRC 1802 / NCYC 2889) TaxID=226230 RepID=J4TWS8_SACK1|nr:NPT1-like protein [Saccharomyces kudriavzevii IFO 1802]
MYKITMHAAVFTNFPDVTVTYKYTNRSSQFSFNKEAITWLKEQLPYLGDLRFTEEEIEYLQKEIPYLPSAYIKYISDSDYKLNPEEQISFTSEEIEGKPSHYKLKILVSGYWKDTMLYEIPLLALISEAYFKFVDTDWDYENQLEQAMQKAENLFDKRYQIQ